MTVILVAAVARNRAIGAHGRLPWHLPEDLRRFKSLTMGHPLVMGRRTYDAIGAPLPGRRTVVVSRDEGFEAGPDVEVAHSVPEALDLAGAGQVFVVGGAEVYADALQHAECLEITEVDQEPADADAFFPEVDWTQWVEIARDPRDGFAFVTYERAVPLDVPVVATSG